MFRNVKFCCGLKLQYQELKSDNSNNNEYNSSCSGCSNMYFARRNDIVCSLYECNEFRVYPSIEYDENNNQNTKKSNLSIIKCIIHKSRQSAEKEKKINNQCISQYDSYYGIIDQYISMNHHNHTLTYSHHNRSTYFYTLSNTNSLNTNTSNTTNKLHTQFNRQSQSKTHTITPIQSPKAHHNIINALTPRILLVLILALTIHTSQTQAVLPTYTYNPSQGQLPPISAPNPENGCYLTKTDQGLVQVCPSSQPTGGKEILATYSSPTKVVRKGIPSNKASLESLEKVDPSLASKIQNIFKYSGIQQPWDRIKDFYDEKQRMMPDPCMLYTEMRDILKVFESLKELISNELRKIQIYVERAKMYLKEDHVKLKDLLSRMSLSLIKMKSTKDKKSQNDYANGFNKLNAETQDEITKYNQMKEWLFQVLKYFRRLF